LASHTVIEHLLNVLVTEGYKAFNIKPKKDHEGYIVLKVPFTYYAISIIMALMAGAFAYLLFLHPEEDFWPGALVILPFVILSYLSMLYVKNTQYRFNDREIIRRNLFKRERIIFWNDCSIKPLNLWSQQITLYNAGLKFKIHYKFIGFNILADLIGRRFNKSRVELGINNLL
jgi:hypothetical protein